MKRRANGQSLDDADAQAVRRVSRAVGLQITLTASVLVVAVLVAAFVFVVQHISPINFFARSLPSDTTVDVGVIDLLSGGFLIGFIAILVAGTMSWFVTRRAVRPLADALRLQRAFVADASHELRTPLSVLDARLQLVQRELAPDHPLTTSVGELRRDTRTLIDIVNGLLASAEVLGPQAGGVSLDIAPVAVNPIVRHAANSLRLIAEKRSVQVTIDAGVAGGAMTNDPKTQGSETLFTRMPEASLNRCVTALLENALEYSPADSTIQVGLSRLKSMARLTVRDEGSGIQGIDPARIFDRFARSAAAGRQSFGIGLSLVRDTAERFGGQVSVVSTSSAGTEFELLIPLA